MFALEYLFFKSKYLVMSSASGVPVQQQQYSIVEYVGYNEGAMCGYCHREEATPISTGIVFCFNLPIILVIIFY